MVARSVTVVRPYEASIRERVFPTLIASGLTIAPNRIIPTGMSDDDVMLMLKAWSHDVLLIPFHGHTDQSQRVVNGLTLAKRIEAELPQLSPCPIIMPVDRPSTALVEKLLEGEWIGRRLRDRMFLLPEDDLDRAGLEGRILRHVRRFRHSRAS